MDIKQITGQHGKTVALVFNKMGIKLKPTPANVVLVTTLYKDQFIDALADAVDQETTHFGGMFSGVAKAVENATKNPQFNEMQTLGNVTVQASYNNKKQAKGEKIKNTLRDVLGLVLTGYGTYKAAKANGQSSAPSVATNPYIPAPLPEEKPKKKFNPWIIGIIAIVVLLIIVFATKKKA